MSEARDILFLCVSNACRSQMAEGFGRAYAPDGIAVRSAGSEPGGVHPMAVRVMSERGIDLRAHESKAVDEIDAERIAHVITLCAEEVCPVFLGDATRQHWPFDDPARVEGDEERRMAAFRVVRDAIEERVKAFVATLEHPASA